MDSPKLRAQGWAHFADETPEFAVLLWTAPHGHTGCPRTFPPNRPDAPVPTTHRFVELCRREGHVVQHVGCDAPTSMPYCNPNINTRTQARVRITPNGTALSASHDEHNPFSGHSETATDTAHRTTRCNRCANNRCANLLAGLVAFFGEANFRCLVCFKILGELSLALLVPCNYKTVRKAHCHTRLRKHCKNTGSLHNERACSWSRTPSTRSGHPGLLRLKP